MGCDCPTKCTIREAWTRQNPLIEIGKNDAITDNGQEIWNLLVQRGIDNVMICGVHLNMCVLGRPFGIRQMTKLGKNVALIRDLTDTMYNHERPPGVNHFRGTESGRRACRALLVPELYKHRHYRQAAVPVQRCARGRRQVVPCRAWSTIWPRSGSASPPRPSGVADCRAPSRWSLPRRPSTLRRPGELAEAGCLDLGESRPQELWQKAAEVSDLPIRWHLIGHLQRNKVERSLPLASLIHSVDSLRLLAAIEAAADSLDRIVPVLLEVNVSGDQTKYGLPPSEMPARIVEAAAFRHVQIRGLMGMAALEGGPERARRDFRALRELRDQLRKSTAPNVSLDELSMGMSDDFEVAIEEGATLVRIGSALFEGLEP